MKNTKQNPTSFRFIALPTFSDKRGCLTVLEFGEIIPFDVKRMFYIYDSPANEIRGNHATYSQQIIICLQGSCSVILHDGKKEYAVELTSPEKGLFLPSLIWRSFSDFSSGCILLCLSDRAYSKTDYIEDFHLFLSIKNKILQS